MTDDENDLSTWQRMKLNFWELVLADTEEQKEETYKPMREKGTTDNPVIGLIVNGATILIGLVVYWWFSGVVAFIGVVFAVLGVLPILRWVIGV